MGINDGPTRSSHCTKIYQNTQPNLANARSILAAESSRVRQHVSTFVSDNREIQDFSDNWDIAPWTGKSCFSNRALVRAIFEALKCL